MNILSVGGEPLAPKVKEVLVQELQTTEGIESIILQHQLFVSIEDTNITNSNSMIYIDTDLIISITPKYNNSKIIIDSVSCFDAGSDNSGTQIKLMYSDDGGNTWNDVENGNSKEFVSYVNNADDNFKYPKTHIKVFFRPTNTNELQFKIVFKPKNMGVTSTYIRNGFNGIIEAIEIKENE